MTTANVTLDAADDDWEWRRKIRSTRTDLRIVVGVVGLVTQTSTGTSQTLTGMLQTDAAISSDNSGGHW